jgi:hypothetical protein
MIGLKEEDSVMKFYKYSPWNGEKGDYTRENLLENAVFLASPEVFNDPFDFNPGYDYSATYQEKKQHITKVIMKGKECSKTKAEREALKILRENPIFKERGGVARFAREDKENLRRVMGVSCFTTKPGNSPMWAHYADNHQGICLEWDFPDIGEHFYLPDGVEKVIPLVLQPVTYANERPVTRMFDDSIQAGGVIADSVITKSTDWKYEDEYRLIMPGYTGKVYYYPYKLSGIIVGYKMPTKQVEEVKQFVKKIKFQPRLYKTQLSERNFDYEIVPMK